MTSSLFDDVCGCHNNVEISQRRSDGGYRDKKKMRKSAAAAAAAHGRVHDCPSRPLVEPKARREIRTELRRSEMLQG